LRAGIGFAIVERPFIHRRALNAVTAFTSGTRSFLHGLARPRMRCGLPVPEP
jgi:hypothetical protein